MSAAQDEGELFDLVDREGAPLGRKKPRALVHRDGDWHRSIHVWVWGMVAGRPHVVLQRRSPAKDTHPGRLDVAVTGHLRAGESPQDALREAEEEIGLRLGPADVVLLGRRRRVDSSRPGLLDHEVQDVFAARGPADLGALSACEAELAGLLAVPLADAARVIGAGARGAGLSLTGPAFAPVAVDGAELVPAPDGYYPRAVQSLAALLAGGAPAPWILG
jgi:8-oxo-dGTP pyrophosphatase MutT (NUDIX family)